MKNVQNPQCAYPQCQSAVGPDDECSGCKAYVCEEHSPNTPWGQHAPEDHWEDADDTED